MLSLLLLQIVAPLSLVFALKRKMYETNFVGFIVIVFSCGLLATSYINSQDQDLSSLHYTSVTCLLLWIVSYSTYKHYKRYKEKK